MSNGRFMEYIPEVVLEGSSCRQWWLQGDRERRPCVSAKKALSHVKCCGTVVSPSGQLRHMP